ncbi:MAG TPA: tetratricopeptide repeat protein [Vicinamibacteria bacterium]
MTIALLVLLAAPPGPATLVLPFDAVGANPEQTWVGPAASELLARGLAVAGVPVAGRGERLRAQAALELPEVSLTRATSLRIAEALGASRLVTGTYAVQGGQLTLSLRLLDAERASLSSPIVASGPLETLADLAHGVAWDVALASSTPPGMTREAFFSRRPSVSFEAVKAYGRGLAAHRAAARLRLTRDALSLAPQFHQARLTLGQLLRDAGEFSAAYETLNRIPADAPESRAARFLQGVALLEVGRYRDASRLYRSLADADATPAVLNNEALAVLRSPGDDGRASDLLHRAADMAPAHTDLLFNLGWALLVEGDAEGAEFSMREVVRRAPLDPQARVVLAWALRRGGGEALESARNAVAALAPNYQTLTTPDLTRHFERIVPAERLLDLDRGGRSEAEVAAGLVGKAQRLVRTGDLPGALAELTRAAYLDPYASGVHTQLARVHRARGDRELALNELHMALWSRDDPALRAELAAVLKEAGRTAEARVEAEKVLKVDPANETARKVLQSP